MGTTSRPIDVQQSRQLNKNAIATTDAFGNATFTFDAPDAGTVWTGTISCPTSPAGAMFIASVALQQWCQWNGAVTAGPVQLFANQHLTVVAAGLQPTTQYALILIGSIDPTSSPPAGVWPDPTSSSSIVPATAQLVYNNDNVNSQLSSGTTYTYNVPPAGRTLILAITAFSGQSVTNVVAQGLGPSGTPFGFVPLYNQPPYIGNTVTPFLNEVVVIPIEVPLATVLITVTISGSFGYNIAVYSDAQAYTEANFYNGPITPKSISGAQTGTVLATGPCRLLSAYANSATGGPSATVLVNGQAVLVTTGGPVANTWDDNGGKGIIVPQLIPVTGTIVTGGQCGIVTAFP